MVDVKNSSYLLNLDKPSGISSAKVVAIVKGVTGAKKVGHCGTLDPFATGVLPIAVNKATKQSELVMGARKKYNFTIEFGENRNTEDIEGKITATSSQEPKLTDLISVMSQFVGRISQVPPRFSAISINGKRCYKRARAGEEFTILPREIEIYSFALLGFEKQFSFASSEPVFCAEFMVECSKGTYIRAISRDICAKLSLCGFVSKLRRTAVGDFTAQKSITLSDFRLKAKFLPRLLENRISRHLIN